MDIILEELLHKDKATVAASIERDAKLVARGVGGQEKKKEHESMLKIQKFLEEEKKAARFGTWDSLDIEVLNRLQLLTAKSVVYLVNLSKKDYLRKGKQVAAEDCGGRRPPRRRHHHPLLGRVRAGDVGPRVRRRRGADRVQGRQPVPQVDATAHHQVPGAGKSGGACPPSHAHPLL